MNYRLFTFLLLFSVVTSMSAQQNLTAFLVKRIPYPQVASEKKIMGLVLVNVLIDEDGKLRKSQVHIGKGGGCNEAVTKAVESIDTWHELLNLSPKGRPIQIPVLFIHEEQYPNRVKNLTLTLDTIRQVVSDTATSNFLFVEKEPDYQGGENQLIKFLGRSIKYPPKAIDRSTCGRVLIGFVIDTAGKVGDVHIVRGIGDGCDEEAMRVVSSMPDWKPGSQNGKRVKVSYQLPILFEFQQNEPKRIFRGAERIDTVKIYNTTDIKPLFTGGESHLKDTLYKMIKGDLKGGGNTKSGTVEASFTVDETGHVMDVKILKSMSAVCDEAVSEALRKLPSFVQVSPEKKKTVYTLIVPFE